MTQAKLGPGHPIDVDKLIESRLLVQANSGAGKSWAIRRLLEQTYAHVPQIVIDVEGEFHTLREKFDYVLAGQKGGDCPADIKSAALLARRLLELNVSAIVDIYELGAQRTLFVRRFLESLVNAPRELWHPLLVVVDEAHMFCPEAGHSESAAAVIDLMTRGRKRGFCGVLATQRIAKLHKDAAAEANNKLIGRSSLDIDMKRAASELGFTMREEIQRLRTLPPGVFYGFGPAIADIVTEIKIGDVQTTHPKAGQRAMTPTPPREKVKKILAQLADLPHEAEEEARTAVEQRAKIKSLEAELRLAKKAAPEPKIVERPILTPSEIAHFTKLSSSFSEAISKLNETIARAASPAKTFAHKTVETLAKPPTKTALQLALDNGLKRPTKTPSVFVHSSNGDLPAGEEMILRALIQYPKGLQRSQLGVLTTYKRSTRDAYIARLREKGLVDTNLAYVFATDAGREQLPNAEPLPTGEALRDFWYRELPHGECQVLTVLVSAYPNSIDKALIDEHTGFQRSTRDAYLSRLAAKELVVNTGRGAVKASETLFEVA